MSAQRFIQHSLQKTELTSFKVCPKTTYKQTFCLMVETHHCCVLLKWEALVRLHDRKPSGKMLAPVSLEPPTADGSNILISLLSRWAKCFRPHKCWLERPCVCPHANMSTLPKQEIQGCCSNRIKMAREKAVEGKERLWKKKTQAHLLVSSFLWRWAETEWELRFRFKRLKLIIQQKISC